MLESLPLKYSVVVILEQSMSSHRHLSTGTIEILILSNLFILGPRRYTFLLTTGGFMQIIHKQKQSRLFCHSTHSIFTALVAAYVIQYSAQVSGAQEWTGWQANVRLVKTQQSLAQAGFSRTGLSCEQHWLVCLQHDVQQIGVFPILCTYI